MTVPAAAAATGVFSFAAILMPLYFIPLGWIPKRVITGPRSGQAKRPLSTLICPCVSSALWAGSGFFTGGGTAALSLSAASGVLAGGAGAGGCTAAWVLPAVEAGASVFSGGFGCTLSGGLTGWAGPRSVLGAGGRSAMLSSLILPFPAAASAPEEAPAAATAARPPGGSAGTVLSGSLATGGFPSAGFAGGRSMTSRASGMKTTLPALMRAASVMLLISASSWRSTL